MGRFGPNFGGLLPVCNSPKRGHAELGATPLCGLRLLPRVICWGIHRKYLTAAKRVLSPFQRMLQMRVELWVLRSTITLKTTDTTLMSVDGNIGHRGALVPLSHASARAETITEETPSATVTLTQSLGRGKARQNRTKSWHRSKPFSVANIKLTGLCKGCTQGL